MNLCLIYTVWDDFDWLRHSLKHMRPLVDGVIIVASEYSNYKEFSPIPEDFKTPELNIREPFFNHPLNCETDKRNFGLQLAKQRGFTHFITLDADELYEPEAFLKAKERFNDPDLQGLVCRTQVYFKSPKLTLGFDHTLVPFIHRLNPLIKHEFNKRYPYAWDNGHLHIDPSRSLNINSGVKMDDAVMHHYSWVRKDYEKKIRNSTARNNILQDKTLLHSLMHSKEGDYIEFYRTRLARATVDFGIPEFYERPLQSI